MSNPLHHPPAVLLTFLVIFTASTLPCNMVLVGVRLALIPRPISKSSDHPLNDLHLDIVITNYLLCNSPVYLHIWGIIGAIHLQQYSGAGVFKCQDV